MRWLAQRHKMALSLVMLSLSPLMLCLSAGIISVSDLSVVSRQQQAVEEAISKCNQQLESRGLFILPVAARSSFSGLTGLNQLTVSDRHDQTVFEYVAPLPERFSQSFWRRFFGGGGHQIQVPVNRQGQRWLTFTMSLDAEKLTETAGFKTLILIVINVVFNLVAFSLFLKRALAFMNRRNAVPTRIRNTLDTIASGIVLLDSELKVLTVNDAFANACGHSNEDCLGKHISEFAWTIDTEKKPPWDVVEQTLQPRLQTIELLSGSRTLVFNANATPVLNAENALAGVLISFEDVTEIEAQRKDLILALRELEKNKEQIRRQNEALQELALRDALTGAHNRRALFDHLEVEWAKREKNGGNELCGVMLDVDHFKKLNDVHGHAAGDSVLRDIANVIKTALGDDGFFARYGGEEFCIVMPDTALAKGIQVAERIRAAIEKQLKTPYAVTSSFGIASSTSGATTPQILIDQADKALYLSKQSGRNQVQTYNIEMDIVTPKSAPALRSEDRFEQSTLSYQTALSLHTAMMHRDEAVASHCQRVADIACHLGRGLLSAYDLYLLEMAALLHEVSVLAAGDTALATSAATRIGLPGGPSQRDAAVALLDAAFRCPQLVELVSGMHDRFDNARGGETIPMGARILAVADAFDTLVGRIEMDEPSPLVDLAFLQLRLLAGTQLDPELVERLIERQAGWRPQPMVSFGSDNQTAVIELGQDLERAMLAYSSGNVVAFKEHLEAIRDLASYLEQPHIANTAVELISNLDRKTAADLPLLLAVFEQLIEVAATLMRAQLRSTASGSLKPKSRTLA